MDASRTSNLVIDWLLKIGIVVFIGSIFYEVLKEQKPDNDFWFWTLRILLLTLFVVLSAFIFGLSKQNYYVFGFFLVLIASLYKIVTIASITFNYLEIPIYILLIAVSFYFITKPGRTHHRHS
jgi:hypothetical protein